MLKNHTIYKAVLSDAGGGSNVHCACSTTSVSNVERGQRMATHLFSVFYTLEHAQQIHPAIRVVAGEI